MRRPQKPYCSCEKCVDVLHRAEISAILAYFCPNLVAMATALTPLKIQIAYLNSPTSKSLYCSCEKCVDVLHRAKISAFLAYFCLNLVAMATPFALLKMLIAYFYPLTTKTLPYTQKVSRYGGQS